MTHNFDTLHDLMAWMKEVIRDNGNTMYQNYDLAIDFIKLVRLTEELQAEFGKQYRMDLYWLIRENGTHLPEGMFERDRLFEAYGKRIIAWYEFHYENGLYSVVVK